jgi:hypothetical protein
VDDAGAPLSAREVQLRLEDRYLGLKARLERVVERMHPVMGHAADLDGLEAIADALDRVALHGDRIEVTSAQRVAADRRRAEVEQDVAALSGRERHEPLPVEAVMVEEGAGLPPAEAGSLERTPGAVLVVKQRPPVARPGRGRGFRLKGEGAADA